MQITLIRHLPTEWNQKTWLQGRQDIPISMITDDIYDQIETNKQHLNKLSPFDCVLASTLKRTHQTAKAYGYECETDNLLDELDFGPFEGLPKANLIKEYGETWVENPKQLVLGESIENLEKRIISFLIKYKMLPNILVFGHGSWIRALLSYSRYGCINNMNKFTAENNQYFTLEINLSDYRKNISIRRR